jgi:copper chaperone
MNQINLNVSGMTCGSCVKHVTKALETFDDVTDIHVDLQNGKVHLQRSSFKFDDLIHALTEEGYPSSVDLDGSVKALPKKTGGCCCG